MGYSVVLLAPFGARGPGDEEQPQQPDWQGSLHGPSDLGKMQRRPHLSRCRLPKLDPEQALGDLAELRARAQRSSQEAALAKQLPVQAALAKQLPVQAALATKAERSGLKGRGPAHISTAEGRYLVTFTGSGRATGG
jgi:hypothetical protein